MPIRGTIENSWYALHMFADPNPPDRVAIWGHRHDDEAAKKLCRKEFEIGNVRRTHEARDPQTATTLHRLYEETIDLGAHPNPRGIWGPVRHDETSDGMTLTVALLTDDINLIASVLQKTLDVGIGALKTLQLVFRDEFRAVALEGEIDRVIDAANVTFQGWVSRPRG